MTENIVLLRLNGYPKSGSNSGEAQTTDFQITFHLQVYSNKRSSFPKEKYVSDTYKKKSPPKHKLIDKDIIRKTRVVGCT